VPQIYCKKLDKTSLRFRVWYEKINKIEKSVGIRPIRIIRVPSPDRPPPRTQTCAALPDTPARPWKRRIGLYSILI